MPRVKKSWVKSWPCMVDFCYLMCEGGLTISEIFSRRL
jgi:hypothetical protein